MATTRDSLTEPTIRKRPQLWVTLGRRKVRVGWSAREAGGLADDPPIPSRTVEHWAAWPGSSSRNTGAVGRR